MAAATRRLMTLHILLIYEILLVFVIYLNHTTCLLGLSTYQQIFHKLLDPSGSNQA